MKTQLSILCVLSAFYMSLYFVMGIFFYSSILHIAMHSDWIKPVIVNN